VQRARPGRAGGKPAPKRGVHCAPTTNAYIHHPNPLRTPHSQHTHPRVTMHAAAARHAAPRPLRAPWPPASRASSTAGQTACRPWPTPAVMTASLSATGSDLTQLPHQRQQQQQRRRRKKKTATAGASSRPGSSPGPSQAAQSAGFVAPQQRGLGAVMSRRLSRAGCLACY
jgi:hypothetical protein